MWNRHTCNFVARTRNDRSAFSILATKSHSIEHRSISFLKRSCATVKKLRDTPCHTGNFVAFDTRIAGATSVFEFLGNSELCWLLNAVSCFSTIHQFYGQTDKQTDRHRALHNRRAAIKRTRCIAPWKPAVRRSRRLKLVGYPPT